jgi:hypothetical protein
MSTGLSVASTSNMSSGQRIFVAQAIMANEPAAPGPDLIESETIPQGTKSWDILSYARFSNAGGLTEGVDLTVSQQLVSASLTLTPSEFGILAQASHRLARRQGDASIAGAVGRMVGASLRRRQDSDVIDLFDGFSKSTPGATNTLTTTHLRGIYAYVRTDNDSTHGPAPLPLVGDLHVEQFSDIVLDLVGTTGTHPMPDGFSAEVLQQWWMGRHRLYQIQLFEGGNIPRDTAGDSKGAIFAKQALYMVVGSNADMTEEIDNSLRATEYGAFQEWATGERSDTWGVEVYSDTAATI